MAGSYDSSTWFTFQSPDSRIFWLGDSLPIHLFDRGSIETLPQVAYEPDSVPFEVGPVAPGA